MLVRARDTRKHVRTHARTHKHKNRYIHRSYSLLTVCCQEICIYHTHKLTF